MSHPPMPVGRVTHWGVALVALAFMLAGCSATSAGVASTPSVTATSTASSSIPNLRYKIGTRNHSLQELANVALPMNSGTNFQWTPANDFQGLTCASEETADPGGPAGHEQYQVFTCQLATSQDTGTGSFTFAEVGSTTAQAHASVEVDSLTGAQGSSPDLVYQITTASAFHAAASVALAVNAGTNYQWSPANDFQGMACAFKGIAHPEGPSGHVQYQVFACQLTAGQTAGHGAFTFTEIGSSIPTETAQISLMLGQ